MKARDTSQKNASILSRPVLAAITALLVGGLAFVPATAGQYGPYPPPAGTSPSSGGGQSVRIKGTSSYRFSPSTVTVKRGRAVNWSWQSNAPHNVTFRSLHKHSKTRQSGSYRLTFSKKGTYRYMCTVHGFTGKVIVK
jgi:plastocyanin